MAPSPSPRIWSPSANCSTSVNSTVSGVKAPFADESFQYYQGMKHLETFHARLTSFAWLDIGGEGVKRLAPLTQLTHLRLTGRVLPDVRTPGDFNVALSLIKDTHLRERLRLQFRAATFNLANHVNLGIPNTTFVPGPDAKNRSGTFGVITTARDARIGQLALRLVF